MACSVTNRALSTIILYGSCGWSSLASNASVGYASDLEAYLPSAASSRVGPRGRLQEFLPGNWEHPCQALRVVMEGALDAGRSHCCSPGEFVGLVCNSVRDARHHAWGRRSGEPLGEGVLARIASHNFYYHGNIRESFDSG